MESHADSEDESDTDSVKQEMENALYAQIHFEENTECCLLDQGRTDQPYSVSVIGNTPAGYKAKKTTSDIILNRSIGQVDDDSGVDDDESGGRDDIRELFKKKKLSEIIDLFEEGDEDLNDYIMELDDLDSDEDSLYGVLDESGFDDPGIQLNITGRKKYRPLLDTKVSEDGKWKINVDDLRPGKRNLGRYHKGFRCHNCNETGHLSKNCPKPKKEKVCGFCAEPGHMMMRCPNSLCYNCDGSGHDARDCPSRKRNVFSMCFRCRMVGHEQYNCPDIWRQFHRTINPGQITPGKRKRRAATYCYNCAGDDHLGHECPDGRMNKYIRVASPFVCRYDKSFDTHGADREGPEEPPRKKQKIETETQTAKKMSSFIIGKNKAAFNTGRNNFDKLQFKNSKTSANKNASNNGKGKFQNKHIKFQEEDVSFKPNSGTNSDFVNKKTDFRMGGAFEDFPRGQSDKVKRDNIKTKNRKNKAFATSANGFKSRFVNLDPSDMTNLSISFDNQSGRTVSDKGSSETSKQKSKKSKKKSKAQRRLEAEAEEEPKEFLNHQVHDNEWWNKNKKKKKSKKKGRKQEEAISVSIDLN